MILALDPGPIQTAWCLYDRDTLLTGIEPNEALLDKLPKMGAERMVVEMIASYGMPVGKEVFETCVWIGRFIQAWHRPHEFVYRKDVKMHLCGSMKAKDSNIRQALLDRFGPPGTKRAPGRTYGLKKDMWAALAVAVTAYDARKPA